MTHVERLGKRIVFAFPDELFLVMHLMIAGRLQWRPMPPPAPAPAPAPAARARAGVGPHEHLMKRKLPAIPARIVLATFEFPHGSLVLTEAGTKKRAWIRLVEGIGGLASLDPGGLEPLDVTPETFREALVRENHTLKRALTDPRLFSGVGNAYSDEILHAARLSPLKRTPALRPRSLDELSS